LVYTSSVGGELIFKSEAAWGAQHSRACFTSHVVRLPLLAGTGEMHRITSKLYVKRSPCFI